MGNCFLAICLVLLGLSVEVVGQPTDATARIISKLARKFATTLSSPIDVPVLPEVNPQCVKAVRDGLPIQALDAFGKPHSGILGQNFNWFGNYEECIAVDGFKHCVADMMISLSAQNSSQGLIMPIFWGICMPDSCSEAEIEYLSLKMLAQINVTEFKPNPQLETQWTQSSGVIHCNEKKPVDTGFICVICACSVLGVLMLCGAALDIYLQWIESYNLNNFSETFKVKSEEHVPLVSGKSSISYTNPKDLNDSPHHPKKSWTRGYCMKLLLCFAVNRSLTKLLNTSQDKKAVTCLNGIRVLSITWIILGHTFQAPLDLLLYENMPLIQDALEALLFTVTSQAMIAVDSFFFLSGFLLAYLTLRKMAQRNGSLPWAFFYFHRFWRLTPVYAAVILFLIYIVPYMGSGPIWYRYQDQRDCVNNWWQNLLYINNFMPRQTLCMHWSWYLSVDVQFYIISPIILILLYRSPKIGCSFLSFLTLLSICLKGGLSAKYLKDATNYSDFFTGGWYEAVYVMPYTRITPYLMGIALGFAMIKRPRIRIPTVIVVAGWFLSIVLGLVTVYIINDFQNRMWTAAGKGTYEALCSFNWAICLTWVVIACHNGYGGWINSFLSWSFWIPLGRLTYSTYLVQSIVIYIIMLSGTSSLRGPISMPMCAIYVSNVVLSFGVALIFALAIEYPCANLEALLLSPKKEERNGSQRQTEQCKS